jgi:large subunit ribosomal protein L3
MAGRLGGKRVTIRNLEVVAIDPKTHRIFVHGAVPGAFRSLLELRKTT